MDRDRSATTAGATLAPVAAAFVVFGLYWGAWSVAAADVERELGVSHGGFGLILSVALAGAALANAFAGTWGERWGTGRVLAAALAAWSVLMAAAAAAPAPAGLIVALVGVITAGGVVDVVMNVAVTAELGGRPGSLVRFHSLFNLGAAAGALGAGLLLGASLSWRWVWVGAAVLAGVTAAVSAKTADRFPAAEAGERIGALEAMARLRRAGLVLVAAAFGIGAMVEGGVETWGVLYLRTQVGSGLAVGAGSAVLGFLIAAAARIWLGPVAGRRGAAVGVSAGAATCAVGILVLVTAPTPALAGVGYVLAAAGVSMCWPLLMALASQGHERPGLVIGAMAAFGYVGIVLGPTVVGTVSGIAGIDAGLLVVAAGAVFVSVAPFMGRR